MKTFLIKIGKSWNVIKRDGFFNGSKRVLQAFAMLFRPVKSGDILFISGGVGDSARYRTTHVAQELTLQGFRCSVTVQDNPRLVRYADQFSVFVMHRVLYTKNVARLIAQIKQQHKTIIFETDDLVYDPQYLKHMDYYEKMNSLEKKLYDNGVGGEILADDYVNVATTTTQFLADKLRARGKEVFIVPNKLSIEDVYNAQKSREAIRRTSHTVRLGYFSGTISHNKDFAVITDALMHVMQKYDNVELLLVGPLDVESILVQTFGDRIKQLPYVERKKHFAHIAQCDINLAPLEYDNPFCEAKSELKFFEAGIVKVPTVAVDNQTYRNAIDDGVDGFVAKNTDEWIEKLSLLIEHSDMRKTMGQKAYHKTMKNYTTQHAQNKAYVAFLKGAIGRHQHKDASALQ